jgi:hypothetical protein
VTFIFSQTTGSGIHKRTKKVLTCLTPQKGKNNNNSNAAVEENSSVKKRKRPNVQWGLNQANEAEFDKENAHENSRASFLSPKKAKSAPAQPKELPPIEVCEIHFLFSKNLQTNQTTIADEKPVCRSFATKLAHEHLFISTAPNNANPSQTTNFRCRRGI